MRNTILMAAPLLCAVSLPAMAQQPPAPEQAAARTREANGVETRVVPVRNMSARLLAFALDPRHQPEPLIVSMSRVGDGHLASPAPSPATIFDVPELPTGASIVEVANEQNTLTLRGDVASLDAWEKAIQAVDKPLRQVEVEVKMVALTPSALKYLQVSPDAPGPHLLPQNFSGKMRELLQSKEALMVSAPRVTAISGLAANLVSSLKTELLVPRNVPVGTVPPMLSVSLAMSVAVRPTVRPDGAVDMEVAAGTSWLAGFGNGAPASSRTAPQEDFRAEDGQSYLLFDRPSPAPPAPAKAQADAEGRVFAFVVTARIIRRVPMEKAVAKD